MIIRNIYMCVCVGMYICVCVIVFLCLSEEIVEAAF